MTWFAASVIISICRKDATNGPFAVYENVILIEAPNPRDAIIIAENQANMGVSIDDQFTLDGYPATKKFEGIRKLINISNPDPYDLDNDPPTTGTEITFSLFHVSGRKEIEDLCTGKEVELRYIE